MDATIEALALDRRRRNALLATRATMEHGFFQRHFKAQGIEALVPEAGQRQELDRVIWERLSHGVVNEESRA
jgi:aspartate racemase